MEAAHTYETSVDNYFTRQYIPEDKSELHSAHVRHVSCHAYSCVGRVRFQILTAASMKMTVFCDVAPYSLVEIYRRFGRSASVISDRSDGGVSKNPRNNFTRNIHQHNYHKSQIN
jgi:hypothetical protein